MIATSYTEDLRLAGKLRSKVSGPLVRTIRDTPAIGIADPGTVLAVQTRVLILAALITGLVILAAAAIWFLTVL